MKQFVIGMFGLGMMLALLGCDSKQSTGKVLATVNGTAITEGDITFQGEINPRLSAQISSAAGRKKILEKLVDSELLYQSAVSKGVHKRDRVKRMLELYSESLVVYEYMRQYVEDKAKDYYDSHSDEFLRLELGDILIKFASSEKASTAGNGKNVTRTEEEALTLANQIIAELKQSKIITFEKMAEKHSDDFYSKKKGGSLGIISRNEKRLIRRGDEVILEKAFASKVGEVTGPIKTSNGYHVIKVLKGAEMEDFEKAKRSIVLKIRSKAAEELLSTLKKETTVIYSEENKENQAKSSKKVQTSQSPKVEKMNPGKATVKSKIKPMPMESKKAIKTKK